jgi:hypothetical protein
MYYTLDQMNRNSSAKISDTKYSCPNYIAPDTKNYYNYFNLPSTQNTNINELPFYQVSQDKKLVFPAEILPPIEKELIVEETEAENIPKKGTVQGPLIKNKKLDSLLPKENYNVTDKFSYNPQKEIKQKNLLPVLDSKFNYREICKQSILLEDHLSVNEKRCTDCCIKHFLALEALSEEALGLDKGKNEFVEFETLPNRIREIQKLWYQDPEANATKCVQDLRKIRKSLMTKCFPIVFDESKKCSGNVCSLK